MANGFFDWTLRNRPLRDYKASRREVRGVLTVILGIGGPLALAADALLYYGMAAFPALLARWHWSADALSAGTLAGFLAIMGLAMAATYQLAWRSVTRPRHGLDHEHDQR